MKIQSVRGMKDLNPTESSLWLQIEKQAYQYSFFGWIRLC